MAGYTYGVRLFRRVLPLVHTELEQWRLRAAAIPVPSLREQALNSLRYKRFHCEGGSVFACQSHRPDPGLVRAIVALQTLSDYLDNLTDRWAPGDGRTARRLHRAFIDAVEPGRKMGRYFDPAGPHDGGYALALVEAVRRECRQRPGYPVVAGPMGWLARRYADLQVLKHLDHRRREPLLRRWAESHGRPWSQTLHWWEFAAATGSTLAMFSLMAASRDPALTAGQVRALAGAYFPWICALHILLDYFIDQEEDRLGGDFNFAACYRDNQEAAARLEHLLGRALAAAKTVAPAGFHALVVAGLPGLYLADGKVARQGLQDHARRLLSRAGWRARVVHRASCWRRRLAGEVPSLQPPPPPPA